MIFEKQIKFFVSVTLFAVTFFIVLGAILPKFMPSLASKQGISLVFEITGNNILISGGILLKGGVINPLSKYRIIAMAKIRDVSTTATPACQMANFLAKDGKTALYQNGWLYINICRVVFGNDDCPEVEPPDYREFSIPPEPLREIFSAVIKLEDGTGSTGIFAITPSTVAGVDPAALVTGSYYCIKSSSGTFEVRISGIDETATVIDALTVPDASGNCPSGFSKVKLVDILGYGLQSCNGAADKWCLVRCAPGENCIFIPKDVYLSACVARTVDLMVIQGEIWTLVKAHVMRLADLIPP